MLGATLTDPLGNETCYAFSAIQLGQEVAASLFAFVPPPGVSVLQAESP